MNDARAVLKDVFAFSVLVLNLYLRFFYAVCVRMCMICNGTRIFRKIYLKSKCAVVKRLTSRKCVFSFDNNIIRRLFGKIRPI